MSIHITLSNADAQALYDHTGTIPYAPRSWSHNVRSALSEALCAVVEVPPRPTTDDEIAALPLIDLADFFAAGPTGPEETAFGGDGADTPRPEVESLSDPGRSSPSEPLTGSKEEE